MKLVHKGVFFALVFGMLGLSTPALAQKLGASEARQLIVENVHTYIRVRYADPISFIAGRTMPTLEQASPEAVLAAYLTRLAEGDVDAALKQWAVASQRLIQKKNATISPAELRQSTIALNRDINFQFIARILYGDYVIVELQSHGTQTREKPNADAYAMKKENGVWKLTQDLADDPVMCCRDAPQSRIRKVGVPGADFRKVLEALK